MNKTLASQTVRRIRFLQHFFYIAFIVLWFKDNFAPLRALPVHYLFALIPWLGLTAIRLYPRIRRFKIALPRKLSRETAAFLIVLLLAVVLRLPFLAAPSGMMTSDDAVPALMGKHIAEGWTPPVCYYGQLYMGSLSSHYYALAFKVFGYSLFVLKCATLLVFLGFMAIQFIFLREVFSFSLALAVSFFYSLPVKPLLQAGLDSTSAFALVLLLGSLILYLTHLIVFRSRPDLLSALGLTMGLAFWTHQITAAFILTSLLILAYRIKWQPRKYATLVYWSILGFLPQILIEGFLGFRLLPFLMDGRRVLNWDKAKTSLELAADLLTPDRQPLRYGLLALALAGLISIILLAWKRRAARPQLVFCLFPLLYGILYFLSDFSNTSVIRYLYPLYAALPVLLLAVFQFMRSRRRLVLSFGLLLLLFFLFNLSASLGLVESNRDRHLRITRLAAAMEETGRRYWMAEYWTSFLLTAVSKERLIVDSYTNERFLPYSLDYWNQTASDNYVFLSRAEAEDPAGYTRFMRWLEKMGVRSKRKEVEGSELVYDIEPRIFRRILFVNPPGQIPKLNLETVELREGYLHLLFRNISSGQADMGFWLTVEIPGFSARKVPFAPAQTEIRVEIPHPIQRSFAIRYYVDYIGIKIPFSEVEIRYSLPEEPAIQRSDPVVFLRGIRPEVPPQKPERLVCEKEAWFEVNRKSSAAARLRLVLDSPFEFKSWRWYGEYSQQVDIDVNGTTVGEKALDDGQNGLDIQVAEGILKPGANLISLKFRYQRWFSSHPLWLIAAFLEKVELN
jgi:hypothetical protein